MHNTAHETEIAQEAHVSYMRKALHDLCQPLTALECRLYLSHSGCDDSSELKEAIAEGLQQCERMMAQVRAMQERLEVRN